MTGESCENGAKLVLNELLTYAFNHVNRCNPASLVQTILDFYTPEEIIKAKMCLWSTFENDDTILLQGTKPSRSNMKLEGTALIVC